MNIRKTSLFVIAAFSIAMVSNSFAQGYSRRRDPSHDAARMHDQARALERLQRMQRMQAKKKARTATDSAASSESQLIITTQTPDTVEPIVLTQIDDLTIIWSSLPLESYDVKPGVHAIVVAPRSDPTKEARVTIDVKPGVRYYLGWHESEPAIWWEESN